MAVPQYPLDWEEILDEYTDADELDLYAKSAEKQGEELHSWLKDQLDNYDELSFEELTNWENTESEREWGRYDARDQHYVYEFKTKDHNWFLNNYGPHRDEVE